MATGYSLPQIVRNMRRVKVFKYERTSEPGKYHYDKIPNGEAMFHQWGMSYEEFETGPGNITTAVIERDDGTIETPEASMIQFIDANSGNERQI